MSVLLGCIADDFTGATDIASVLKREGMRVLQINGNPAEQGVVPQNVDAVVIALKSRTQPVNSAVSDSLAACNWLLEQGVLQVFFKYCSTFDSTKEGNIGPVIDALLTRLKTDQTIVCPSYPINGRTLYASNLFVHGMPLAESAMKDHPLTPMTDSNLIRLLEGQTKHVIKPISWQQVQSGVTALAKEFESLKAGIYVVDALVDEDLVTIAHAAKDMTLLTGGAALAQGLPSLYRKLKWMKAQPETDSLKFSQGHTLILAGSCSTATRSQIEYFLASYSGIAIDAIALSHGGEELQRLESFIQNNAGADPILVYASDAPENIAKVQAELGVEVAGKLVENCMAQLAIKSVSEYGVNNIIVAGGETSGAVVSALGTPALVIGDEIEPGVPWTFLEGEKNIALALKSGNFGSQAFFVNAFDMTCKGGVK